MATWDSGYITEIEYTFGYYSELNPLHLKLALLSAGIMPPRQIENACELGFGQGLSTNIHASASKTKWYGTDFNPSQAGFAQDISVSCENGAKFYDMSFDDFSDFDDLPEFDFIGLHGIWSWIAPEHQASIVEFIRKKLKVGGMVYTSYNVLPGWATFAPIRHLMKMVESSNVAKGDGIVSNVEQTLKIVKEFLDANPTYVKANPGVIKRFEALVKKDKNYLAHEYFNESWDPMYFSDIHAAMQPAKLDFACTANYLDHFDFLSLTEEQRKFYEPITDPVYKQTVRDFMVNQQFRKDVWVKGARKIPLQQQRSEIGKLSVIMLKDLKHIGLKLKIANGEAKLNAKIYNPILEAVADGKIYTIAKIEQKITKHKIPFQQLLQALMVLHKLQGIMVCHDELTANDLKSKTDKLNRILVEKSITGQSINYLSSPVTGGAIPMKNNSLVFISAMHEGNKSAVEISNYAYSILSKNNQVLMRSGKQITKAEDIKAILKTEATEFLKNEFPTCKRLLVV